MFCLLVVGSIYTSVDESSIPYSLLFFTCAFALFFLLSTEKKLLFLYIGISIVIELHHTIVVEAYSSFTILLFLFLTIIASFMLSKNALLTYLVINFLFSITVTYGNELKIIEVVMTTIFIYFLILLVNRMAIERNEQKKIYDKLTGEYRQLKRLNLRTEEATRIEERTKIARDIHDSVGHRLTALIMKLEVLAIQNPDTNYRALKQMANESLEETREAVKALQAEENEGIATVVHLIRKLEAESHVLVQFTMKQGVLSVNLSNEKSIMLYRVIQEALTNAMRHAQAREVHVILGKSANEDISFEVSNQQFKAKNYELGFGLENMKERINQVNGTLHVYQTENQFVVSGTIPQTPGVS
ncbi:sensor histidine kinase [Virgibacillus necropolis]|uniref:histidine kinase n=2 Tax=Virgibacillus necropolis TaxID=163877 RepID=A0A221MIF0_9BACI|nr:sensor histidine kinase [Virgibacillus necropolis]